MKTSGVEAAVDGGADPRGGALLQADSNAIRTNTKAKRNGIEEVATVRGIYHCHGAMPSRRRLIRFILGD